MRRLVYLSVLAGVTVLAGCVGAEKSSNPLTPTVAGPIPGVEITPPNPMQPNGARIPEAQQPVSLVVNNASTSGVRPLNYLFEIAVDVNFTNKVYTREGITPDSSGRTTLQLPDPLATGHTYYWRSRAQDGANTGPYSNPASFDIFTPIVIQAPVLVAPVQNVVTETIRPRFTVNNAAHSGPVGAISYVFELSETDTFANDLFVMNVPEGSGGQTSVDAPGNLPYSAQIFWRARAGDPTTVGPFAPVAVFRTPAAPPPPPPPPPSGGGGGGGGGQAANDAINLGLAQIHSSPGDIASWPVTLNITSLTMSSPNGLSFGTSPAVPFNWRLELGGGDNFQYTVWAAVNVGGVWHAAGFIQMWQGRSGTGAPILSDFHANWAYDCGRWPFLCTYFPQVGDQMAFFISAGNARGEGGVTSVRERSNVVVVPLPPNDTGFFSW